MYPVLGQGVILRYHDLNAGGIDFRGNGGIHVFGNRLESDPAAAVAGQLPAEDTEIEHFLYVGRVQHRAGGADEHVIALVRQGRRLAGVVIADHGKHAAVARGTEGVGVLEHVEAAVEAGALAVPHTEYAVVFCAFEQADLLTAPDRGHRQVFVDARLKVNVVRLRVLFGAPQRLIESAERRAAVAGNKAGGVEAAVQIALVLQDGEPDQGLDTGHEGAALVERVLVVERNRHGCGSSRNDRKY